MLRWISVGIGRAACTRRRKFYFFNDFSCVIIRKILQFEELRGGVAQSGRAIGSYPVCHRFKSYPRYHVPFATTRCSYCSGTWRSHSFRWYMPCTGAAKRRLVQGKPSSHRFMHAAGAISFEIQCNIDKADIFQLSYDLFKGLRCS